MEFENITLRWEKGHVLRGHEGMEYSPYIGRMLIKPEHGMTVLGVQGLCGLGEREHVGKERRVTCQDGLRDPELDIADDNDKQTVLQPKLLVLLHAVAVSLGAKCNLVLYATEVRSRR